MSNASQGLDAFDARLGAWIAAWVDAVRRRPLRVIAAVLLLTSASVVYSVNHLGIQGDTDSLFSAELPFKRHEKRFYAAFPNQFETMFVVIDAPTPEQAGVAAEALAARLAERPQDFRTVYLPGGGEFFERNAFLYMDTQELADLADELAEAQPYLAELSRDGTLRGLASILARGARAVRDGDVAPERLSAMYAQTAQTIDAELEQRQAPLSWAEVLASREFEGDPRRRVILVQPVLHVEDIQPARRAIEAVHEEVASLGLEQRGARVRVTGDVALSYEEMEVVKGQASTAGVASFVLVGLILLAGLRSPRLVLATLTTLVVGLVLTAGFTALAVGHFNMISVAFAVLYIGLGVDFGIHVCMRYRELLGEGFIHPEALRGTARDVGSSLVLCAVTTSVGFFAFVPTGFSGVAELGLISGGGMLISLFCMLTLLPALISLPPVMQTRKVPRGRAAWTGHLVELPVRHPRLVRATALVFGLGAALLVPQARFDNNPINVRDPGSESVKTFKELLDRGTSSPWSLNSVAPDAEAARELASRYRALPEVDRVVTLADFVPEDQDEKLDIIEEVALFLGPVEPPGGGVASPAAEETLASLRHLQRELEKLDPAELPEDFAASVVQLHDSLTRFLAAIDAGADTGEALAELEQSLLGSLPEQLRILTAALGARRVTLENLPDALVDQMVAEDGRVRVQVFPHADLTDQAGLARFVDAVQEIDPTAAGSASEIIGSGRVVVESLREALLSALVLITLIVFLLWRRLTDTALVMIPLALATVLTVAASVLLEIPFNYADVIVLPLLLGIGVDSGIHLVHRARISAEADLNLLGTSTARAVAFSAVTTIASFGTMGLATHRGLATLGQMLTLGVSFTLLCNLVVLPALIVLHPRRSRVLAISRPR